MCSHNVHTDLYSVRTCGQHAQLLTSLVDNTIDLPWQNFLVQNLGQNSEGKYTLTFGSTGISL